MRINKYDIGAEILSILTKGMYPDPRDAVREYIQNGIDAGAKNIQVKVRLNSVVIEDDGIGMNFDTLRKAIRLGISDKNPKSNVGFMGIGIYSAFNLCEILTITTRQEVEKPIQLTMNFKAMKKHLIEQKELRFQNRIESNELTDLQTLLQDNITIIELSQEDFPHKGTWVELEGIEPMLYECLNKFDSIANYLREVIPLYFDKENFKWAEEIENKIHEICREHDADFKMVNLRLRVNNRSANLFRPYKDSDFGDNKAQKPIFEMLKHGNDFLGVAWGCLNSIRRRISEKNKRGFILKKQGFSIGRRDDLAHFFGRSNTYFDRYIGEVILVNPSILPNAARDNLAVSKYKIMFEEVMVNTIARHYVNKASKFQEENIAEEKLNQAIEDLKRINNKYNPFEENTKILTKLINEIELTIEPKNLRISKLPETRKQEARTLKEEGTKLKRAIKERLDLLIEKQKNKRKKRRSKINQQETQRNVAKKLSSLDSKTSKNKNYDSLLELLSDLDIDFNRDIELILNIIDDKFIQNLGKSNAHYQYLLTELKNDYLNQNSN